jgi:hypothetical protein
MTYGRAALLLLVRRSIGEGEEASGDRPGNAIGTKGDTTIEA